MAELIEFSAHLSDVDHLPQPADPYRAHAQPVAGSAFMLAFVLNEAGITCYRYSTLGPIGFKPAASPEGLDVLTLQFSPPELKGPVAVRVEGRNLLDLFSLIAEQSTHWLRVLPDGWVLDDPAVPVITRITLPTLPLRAGSASGPPP